MLSGCLLLFFEQQVREGIERQYRQMLSKEHLRVEWVESGFAQNREAIRYLSRVVSNWMLPQNIESPLRDFLTSHPDVLSVHLVNAHTEKSLAGVSRTLGEIKSVPPDSYALSLEAVDLAQWADLSVDDIYLSSPVLQRNGSNVIVPHQPIFYTAIALSDTENQSKPLIVVEWDASRLLQALSASLVAPIELYVVNGKGGFIVHPREDMAFNFDKDEKNDGLQRKTWSQHFISRPLNVGDEHHLVRYESTDTGQVLWGEYSTIVLNATSAHHQLHFYFLLPQHAVEKAVADRLTTPIVLLILINIGIGFAVYFGCVLIQRQQTLKQIQEEYKAVSRSTSNGLIWVDQSGIIKSWNEAAIPFLGDEVRYAKGQSIFDVISFNEAVSKTNKPPIDKSKLREPEKMQVTAFSPEMIESVALTREAVTINVTHVNSHDEAKMWRLGLIPSITSEVNASGVTILMEDVTDLRNGVNALARVDDVVAEEVALKTRQLTQERDEALAASQTKGDFIARVSHEIRTPMNGVLGMLNLLGRDTVTSEQRRYIKLAEDSAQALITLINEILDFSKIEAGRIELDTEAFDLLELLSDLSNAMAVKAHDKNLELVLDVANVEYINVLGDGNRLRQILVNLIGNALKFTETGEIVVTANTTQIDEETLRFECRVIDSGIGIREEILPSLFTSYTQESSGTHKRFGGTGLGLAISKQLCELMEGTIDVESERGRGSTFRFDVILKKEYATSPPVIRPEYSDVRIIIAEKNAAALSAVCRLAKCAHMDATAVGDATTLQSVLSHGETFDVMLIDQAILTTLDIALVKQHASIIVGMNPNGVNDDSEYEHALHHLPIIKPVTPSELWASLSSVLDVGEFMETLPVISHRDENQYSNDERAYKNEGMHVMLVDDNEVNLAVGSCMLEDMGLSVTTYRHGRAAVEALFTSAMGESDKSPYHLVLMDCQMPVLDGYEATRFIRNGDAGHVYQDIPIVAMTANVMSGAREHCLEVGMNDYISKPIDPDELEEKVTQWLDATESFRRGIKMSAKKEETSSPNQRFNKEVNTDQTTYEEKILSVNEEGDMATSASLYEGEDFQLWDSEICIKRLRGREDRALILVDMFLQSAPERLARLQEAYNEKNYEQLQNVAHEVKGVAGNLSCLRLQAYLKALEAAAKAKEVNDIDALIGAAKLLVEETSMLLQEFASRCRRNAM
ncbi:hypothetical protein GCM10007877_31060 [Marinibactrum halimedae]|uniref:histidine kinase n=1 Tax=Marinibactrum halimedae TaxID=1444977 RepID=A0AA37TE80_9GAMM|nr:hypothetical protein GCM10007877_31060 [Marinibactrum halimedae]